MNRASILAFTLLAACSSEDPDPEAPAEVDRDALLACESDAFTIGRPLSGPGLDENGFVGEPLASYIVHTTQIIPKPEMEEAFFEQSVAVFGQLATSGGMVAYGFALDDECGDARTVGVWESEETMYAFAGTGEHVKAMARTHELSLAGRVAHWTATPEEILALDWAEVKARIAGAEISPLYP
jgi:hypothetical protein